MDARDKTPTHNYDGSYSQEGLSGFALYESAVDFFKKLGIQQEVIEQMPEIVLTSVGSLLNQIESGSVEVNRLHNALAEEKNTSGRLRAQRNALRGMFERMGHDPMPGYESQSKIKALRPEDLA